MIRIFPQPEPEIFDDKVRKPGKAWLDKQDFYDPQNPKAKKRVPKKTKFPTYWLNISKEIYDAYRGICAYLGIYFEQATGASSVDHFLPKTLYPGLTYEWDNYRLSCLGINRKKGQREEIMDPFLVPDHAFHINFSSGRMFPNPAATRTEQQLVQHTIDELNLNSANIREMRCKHIDLYANKKVSANYMQTHSPYVWAEIKRQHLE